VSNWSAPPVPVAMDSEKTKTVEIVVNGGRREVPPGLTLLDILEFLQLDPRRVAVELNRRIVRQPDWDTTPVGEGAALEIVHFVGGG
jgi:sulfur carrier protein